MKRNCYLIDIMFLTFTNIIFEKEFTIVCNRCFGDVGTRKKLSPLLKRNIPDVTSLLLSSSQIY